SPGVCRRALSRRRAPSHPSGQPAVGLAPSGGVLVVGATGTIGRHCASAAKEAGLRPRALVRAIAKAEQLFADVDLVRADLEDPQSLATALQGASLIVMTHGAPGEPDAGERIDYGGMRNVPHALGAQKPRIALMSS